MTVTELTKEYQLRTGDFDRWEHIQPAAVLDVFQDVAAQQATLMGIGLNGMTNDQVFWAVVRMKYEMVGAPQPYDSVMARTWPHTPSRYAFQRDYSMRSKDGDLLVKATSEWVLMDIHKRTFASIYDYYQDEGNLCTDRAFDHKARKLRDFEADGEPSFVFAAGASDIDMNGHVNNARYAAYAMDALNLGEHEKVRLFQIDFRHEIHVGERIEMYSQRDGSTLRTKGINADGKISFACQIELA